MYIFDVGFYVMRFGSGRCHCVMSREYLKDAHREKINMNDGEKICKENCAFLYYINVCLIDLCFFL